MHIVKLKLSEKLHTRIEEIRTLRSVATIEHFFLELADAEISQFQMLRIDKSFLQPQGPPDRGLQELGSLERKRRFRGEQSQIILALHLEDIPAPAIAVRLSCSVMKVHRVIANYENSKTHVPESTHVIIRKGVRAKSPLFNPSERRT